MEDRLCPCGSLKLSSECCGPFLSGSLKPKTALDLMRSRYTAYHLKNGAYLLKTWHQSTCPVDLGFLDDDTEWVGLNVVRYEAGGIKDSEGVVEFIASYRQGGVLLRFRECSRFLKELGEWFYLDGIVRSEPNPGRNDPCWCGSGKKYKKCCG